MQFFTPGSTPVFLGSSGLGQIADALPAQIHEFDVYYLEDFIETGSCVDIRWEPCYSSEVVFYKLWRSLAQTPDFTSREDLELLGTFDATTFNFVHQTGSLSDYYGISTVDAYGNETKVTPLKSATDYVPRLCKIEGKVITLQGARKVDVPVVARLVNPPSTATLHNIISKKDVRVLTGEDGRFSLPVVQGAKIILLIADTQVCDPIIVPSLPAVAYETLDIYEEYKIMDL